MNDSGVFLIILFIAGCCTGLWLVKLEESKSLKNKDLNFYELVTIIKTNNDTIILHDVTKDFEFLKAKDGTVFPINKFDEINSITYSKEVN